MTVRSREDAVRVFGGRLQAYAQCPRDSIDEYYLVCGPILWALEKGTRASIIRDLTKERITALAEEDTNLRVLKKGNSTSFLVDGEFLFRLKKLDEKLRVSVSKTRASHQFNTNGSLQQHFDFGDQPATTAYIGYAPTENDPRNPTMYLVCNDGPGEHAWEPIPLCIPEPEPGLGIIPEERAAAKTGVKIKVAHRRAQNE